MSFLRPLASFLERPFLRARLFGTQSKFQIYSEKNGLGYRADLPLRCCALVLLLEPDVSVLGLPKPLLLRLNWLHRPEVDLLVVVLVVHQLDDQLLLGQGEQI